MLKFLVHDYGLFAVQAAALLDGGKNWVGYYTPWQSAFPSFADFIIGQGLGMEKILYFFDHVDDADVIVNFDVYGNDLIAFLRRKGYRVFGSGSGEILEDNRWFAKKLLKKIGLPVNNAVKIRGTTALREYLKKNKDKYVKIDIFRRDIESFHAKDYDSVELLLDEIDANLGPFKDVFDFIVEETISAEQSVEPGFDGFFNGKEFVKPYIIGYEIQKAFYIAKFVNQMPLPMQNTLDKLTPILRQMDYRGAISIEEKVVSKNKSYVLDFCSRLPAPLSAGYVEWIRNFPELVWKISGKEDVKIKPVALYLGALPLESQHAQDNWVRILVDENLRNHVKFRKFVKQDGKYYAVKGLTSVVVLVEWGKSIDEVFNKLKKLISKIEAYGLQTDAFGGLEIAKEEIEKGRQMGISF